VGILIFQPTTCHNLFGKINQYGIIQTPGKTLSKASFKKNQRKE
jgi:hypothetical protein